MNAFGIPATWKPESQDIALESLLRGWRDSVWARDPASAHGLVCPQRSGIFRAVESTAVPSGGGSSVRPDQHLSAPETAKISAALASKSLSIGDVQSKDGRWAVGTRDPAATTSAAAAGSPPYQSSRLRRSAQAQGCFPRGRDHGLDPFTEWPWEQSLLVHAADSYTMLGRRLRHALTWCNRHFTDQLTTLSRDKQEREQHRIFDNFVQAVESQQPERALLAAT